VTDQDRLRRQQYYTLIKDETGFFVVLGHWQYGTQIWTEIKPRKPHKCTICRADIAMQPCYRPITNRSNRMERICIPCMAAIISEDGGTVDE